MKAKAFSAILPVLLVLVGVGSDRHLHGGVSAQSSTEIDAGFCLEELADCSAATVCNSCAFSFTEATCTDYEFDTTDSCSLLGTSFCCAGEASGLTCESDALTLVYWECALQRSGCTLLDMPCMVDGLSDRGTSGETESSVGDPELITSDGDAVASDGDTAANPSNDAVRSGPSGTARTIVATLALTIAGASSGISFSS